MLIYVACWPLLAYLAGNLIPAIGSGDLSKVSSIIIKSLFVFLVQKTAQFGQDVFIAKPSLEISEVMRGNLFSRIQKIKLNSVENISAGDITYRLTEDADRVSEVIYKTLKLDQFLKWQNLVSSGGEAKIFIKSGHVKVNGEIETRRGRKLNKGDKVMFLKNELIFE